MGAERVVLVVEEERRRLAGLQQQRVVAAGRERGGRAPAYVPKVLGKQSGWARVCHGGAPEGRMDEDSRAGTADLSS
jgi:hypothetical protein